MSEINRILSSGILLFVGIGLNMLLGNYIVTTIGCFLLGLVLNRGYKRGSPKAAASKSQLAQPSQISPSPSSPPTIGAGIRCSNCGAFSSGLTNYCASCGSRLRAPASLSNQTGPGRYSPQLIANSLSTLRARDQAQYVDVVQNLLMVDERGDYWSIGVNSSKWYVQGAGGWVPSQPYGTMQLMQRNKPILERRQTLTSPQFTPQKTASKICRFCGAEMRPSDSFCLNCGRQASAQPQPTATLVPPPRMLTCKQCGATVNPRKRFCTKCGALVPASR